MYTSFGPPPYTIPLPYLPTPDSKVCLNYQSLSESLLYDSLVSTNLTTLLGKFIEVLLEVPSPYLSRLRDSNLHEQYNFHTFLQCTDLTSLEPPLTIL